MGFGHGLASDEEDHMSYCDLGALAPVQQKKEQEPGNISPDTNLVVGGSWHTTTLGKIMFSVQRAGV